MKFLVESEFQGQEPPRTQETTKTTGTISIPRVGFGFLVITRDHGSFGRRHLVEIFPTDLPELFKPARDLLEAKKTNFREILGRPPSGFWY